MTYSHNSVRNNLKMTTAAAATTTRLKNGTHGSSNINNSSSTATTSSPTTPPPPPLTTTTITAHSNSIASSTNYQYQPALSSSPPGCLMSSSHSTSSNCSSTSNGSYFAARKQQLRKQQQQRQSPTTQANSDSGTYFANNNQQYYQQQSKQRAGGSAQKQRGDGYRSPPTRQSPAVILGSGASSCVGSPVNPSYMGSARKQRPKHTSPLLILNNNTHNNSNSNIGCGGKISPTHPLLPTVLTHFAGSKCFDAPAPTALPKPPQHWTLSKSEQKVVNSSSAGRDLNQVVQKKSAARATALAAMDAHTCAGHVIKTSKRNLLDDFDTHNLKLLLNVQS